MGIAGFFVDIGMWVVDWFTFLVACVVDSGEIATIILGALGLLFSFAIAAGIVYLTSLLIWKILSFVFKIVWSILKVVIKVIGFILNIVFSIIGFILQIIFSIIGFIVSVILWIFAVVIVPIGGFFVSIGYSYRNYLRLVELSVSLAYDKVKKVGYIIVGLFSTAGVCAAGALVYLMWGGVIPDMPVLLSIIGTILIVSLSPSIFELFTWIGVIIYKVLVFILFPVYTLILFPFRYKGAPKRPVVQPEEKTVKREIIIHKALV